MKHLYPTYAPRFPPVISSTLLSDLRACRHLFYLRHILGLKPKGPSIHLHAGSCFAKGVETVRKSYFGLGLDADTSIGRGWAAVATAWGEDSIVEDDHLKTLRRTQELLVHYFERWPLAQETLIPYTLNGSPAVECNFAIPLPISHPETGDPLIYAGTFDMLGEESGLIFVNDEKTASQLGPTWPEKWTLRGQFISYVWGARSYGVKVAGVTVRGACFLKNDYSFAHARVLIPEYRIDEWYEGMLFDVRNLADLYNNGYFPKDFGDSCSTFGGCSYKTLCVTPQPEDFAGAYYEVEYYDPLKFLKD